MRQLIQEIARDYLDDEQGFIIERIFEIPYTPDEPSIDEEITIEGRPANEADIAELKRQILKIFIQTLATAGKTLVKQQVEKN
jgi:hypothetical protein